MPKATCIGCWLCHGPIWESCDNKVGIFFSMKKMYCFHIASTLRMKMHSQSPARLNGRGHQAAVWHIVLMFGCTGTSWAFNPPIYSSPLETHEARLAQMRSSWLLTIKRTSRQWATEKRRESERRWWWIGRWMKMGGKNRALRTGWWTNKMKVWEKNKSEG